MQSVLAVVAYMEDVKLSLPRDRVFSHVAFDVDRVSPKPGDKINGVEVGLPFSYRRFQFQHGQTILVYIPHWFVAALLAAFLGLVIIRAWRRHRGRTNACRCCGYNLTGNISGRCPECGTPLGEPDHHG
jgi:hypothetical protein